MDSQPQDTGPLSWTSSNVASLGPVDGGVVLCAACSRLGSCRLGLTVERLTEDGSVRTELTCSADNEGGPGVAHGGWTAAVMDELVGHVSALRGVMAVTGTLTVTYAKPVPIGLPLVATAAMTGTEGRRIFVRASLQLASSGVELAACEAVMVRRDPATHFAQHKQWLQEQSEA